MRQNWADTKKLASLVFQSAVFYFLSYIPSTYDNTVIYVIYLKINVKVFTDGVDLRFNNYKTGLVEECLPDVCLSTI